MERELPLGSLALCEIVERHRFFERWFNGEAGAEELAESLLRFDPLFCRIDPAGRRQNRAALEAALVGQCGSRRGDPLRIAVEEPGLLWCGAGAVLATYVEAQSARGVPMPERRRSTALFVAEETDGPLRWRPVQETVIPPIIEPGGPVFTATTPGDGP